MPCDQLRVPLENNVSSFGNVGDWYLIEAILLTPILNITGQGFVPGWRVIGQRFGMWFGFRKIEGVGAAILPEILNLVLRAELRLDDVRWVSLREPAHHHAPPPPCNRSSPSRSGLEGPELLHSLSGIRDRPSSELTRASCPGYGCARSSGIHAYRHAAGNRRCEVADLEPYRACNSFKLQTSPFALQRSDSPPTLVLRLRWLGLAR